MIYLMPLVSTSKVCLTVKPIRVSTQQVDPRQPHYRHAQGHRQWQCKNVLNSTRFIEDGSYIRIKSLTLAYNFSGTWLTKAGLSALRLYATGQNLFTITGYSGYDPEVNAFGRSATELGIDYGTYPHSMVVTMGVKADF